MLILFAFRSFDYDFREMFTTDLMAAINWDLTHVRIELISAGSSLVSAAVYYPFGAQMPSGSMPSDTFVGFLTSTPGALLSAALIEAAGEPGAVTSLEVSEHQRQSK